MFVQFHTLTGYAGVLLNRDDAGMAKRITYGDATRTRTSSQFAKRKIRLAEGEFSLKDNELGLSVRSREVFRRKIAEPLIAESLDKATVVDVVVVFMDTIFKLSAGGQNKRKEVMALIAKGEADPIDILNRLEINVLSQSEIDYVAGLVRSCVAGKSHDEAVKAAKAMCADKEFSANLKEAGKSMSLDVAMYGRMITGDALSSVDAAVSVAHALTVHSQSVETDFFTAVDDLASADDEKGGGHLGETELTSPLLYGFYVLDTKQLAYNLAGAENASEIAGKMAAKFVRLIAEHIVGAKKGSTAPYSSADLLLVEIGTSQPRSLAEAYRHPSKPTLEAAVSAMGKYMASKDSMYGQTSERLVAASTDVGPVFGSRMTMPELASTVAARVQAAV